jgi:hypothetical protein
MKPKKSSMFSLIFTFDALKRKEVIRYENCTSSLVVGCIATANRGLSQQSGSVWKIVG